MQDLMTLRTVEAAVRSNCRKGQEGAGELEERFQDANLHAIQELPERLQKLSQMAKASRRIVESFLAFLRLISKHLDLNFVIILLLFC